MQGRDKAPFEDHSTNKKVRFETLPELVPASVPVSVPDPIPDTEVSLQQQLDQKDALQPSVLVSPFVSVSEQSVLDTTPPFPTPPFPNPVASQLTPRLPLATH